MSVEKNVQRNQKLLQEIFSESADASSLSELRSEYLLWLIHMGMYGCDTTKNLKEYFKQVGLFAPDNV